MSKTNPRKQPTSKEEQTRLLQEAMIEHRRRMETDEEYRKEMERFSESLTDLGPDNEES